MLQLPSPFHGFSNGDCLRWGLSLMPQLANLAAYRILLAVDVGSLFPVVSH